MSWPKLLSRHTVQCPWDKDYIMHCRNHNSCHVWAQLPPVEFNIIADISFLVFCLPCHHSTLVMFPVGLPVFILQCPSASSSDSHLHPPILCIVLLLKTFLFCPSLRLTQTVREFLSTAGMWYIIELCKRLHCAVDRQCWEAWRLRDRDHTVVQIRLPG